MIFIEKEYYIIVTPFFPSSNRWQGAYVLDQAKAIKRNSAYDVIVFKTQSLTMNEKDYEIDGIKVYTLRPLLMPSYILNGLTEEIVGWMFVRKLFKLGISLNQIKFVHCHTTNHSAFGFGVKKHNPNTKVLIQFHDLDPLTLINGKWAAKKWNRLFRAKKSLSALNRADLLICISEPVRDALLSFPHPRVGEIYPPALTMLDSVRNMSSVIPKHLYILNNGVDTALFNPINNDTSKDKAFFRIGCVANFQALKDHMSLLIAFNTLVKKGLNLRLSLLGSGETKQEIANYIEINNLEQYVEWPEEVQHDKLPEYYRSLDLFVLPSRYEGFGCVYTEAYACGVPFICCEYQGAAEVIPNDEKEYWLVESQNPKHLAELIEKQYLNRRKQRLIKPYDINILITEFLDYIGKI